MSYRLLIAILTIAVALVVPASSALAQDATADKAGCGDCSGCEEGCDGCDVEASAAGDVAEAEEGDCGEGCGGCDSGDGAVGKTCWIKIEGMKCGNCAMKVAMALDAFDCIDTAAIDRKAGEVMVTCKPGCCEPGCCESIAAKISEAGYKASLIQTQVRWFYVNGCNGTCSDEVVIEQAMMTVKGVRAVAVRGDEASVVFDARTNVKEVMASVLALNTAESGTAFEPELITESVEFVVENLTDEQGEMIEKALANNPDVAEVACAPAMNIVVVTIAQGSCCAKELKAKIQECGVTAKDAN